ncbi:MAG: hypothetical protein QOG85_21 [Gaiellaceae bacterium]|nr:hypothetical protein [Gaiellaceae bacterium]
MGSSGEEVRVPIGVPVETNASAAADDVAGLRDQISRSKDVIRDANNHLKHLSGSCELVKAAKNQLKAAVDKEKLAVAAATVNLLKQGTTYDKLALQAKEAAKQQLEFKKKTEDALKKKNEERAKGFGAALARLGGPVGGIRDKLAGLGELATHVSGSGGLGMATLAVAGLAAAAAAAVAVVGALGFTLARWAIKGADAARSMQLVRDASTRSSLSARNLGEQVDALAMKVPTSTDALNQLGASLARSRLGGQQTIDLMNAMAQASAALGDDAAANKMKEIVERGRLAQRMYIGLTELQGTGLDFSDVAEALATSMHVGVDKARQALLSGKVSLGDGAKALKDATQKKFGGINLQKMMSLEGLSSTFGKMLQSLTKGIDLEPAVRGIFKLIHAFDESTATGAILKRVVTVFGNGIVSAVEKGAPLVKSFLRSTIISGLKAYIVYLEFKKQIVDLVDQIKRPLAKTGLLGHVDMLAASFDVLGYMAEAPLALIQLALISASGSATILSGAITSVGAAFDFITSLGWEGLGGSIVDGIIDGITGDGAGKLVKSIIGLGEKAKTAFKNALGIHSPSKVFEGFGKQTTAGYT